MARASEGDRDARRDLAPLSVGEVGQQRQRPGDILRVIQGQRRGVLAVATLVRLPRLLLLEMRRVRQDDAHELVGRGGRVDPAGEPVGLQARQVAAVVDVGVGEHHGRDAGRLDGQPLPVAVTQVTWTLEQPAVHHQLAEAAVEQVLAARDGPRRAQEAERGAHRRRGGRKPVM